MVAIFASPSWRWRRGRQGRLVEKRGLHNEARQPCGRSDAPHVRRDRRIRPGACHWRQGGARRRYRFRAAQRRRFAAALSDGIRSNISEARNCVSSSVTFSAMTFHQRTDETFSEHRQASRQSASHVSAPRTRIIRPSRLRGGTPAVRPPLLRSPASKPHGSLMRQLRRAVGADPSLKRQAKPDRRSASRRARAIPFVPKKTVEQQDIQALHRARQRGGREGTLFVRNHPAIRGLVGWRAYMCAPARARRTYASRPPGRGAFFACRGLSFLKARRNR